MLRPLWKYLSMAMVGVLVACLSITSRAVIFYSTGDLNFNTAAPDGTLAGSGWQFVGFWVGFQGAPIGPHHFIAARHIGGAVGDSFVFNGNIYQTTAFFDDPASDLRIWEISGTFSTWAPLYRSNNEAGRSLVVFGRGLTRGNEVRVNGTLKGWQWGIADGRLRWGTNTVASTVNGGSYWGDLLYSTFDASGGTNEAHLAVGDSSGPVFIHNGTEWALAGVAAAVDSYFNTTNTGDGFIAALFDVRGLYYSSDPATMPWQLVSGPAPIPSGFYATRISTRVAWIESIIPPTVVPEGADAPLLGSLTYPVLVISFFGVGVFFLQRGRRLKQCSG